MSLAQNLWLILFNFGPPIFLAIFKSWWVGLFSLVCIVVLSRLFFVAVSSRLDADLSAKWAWLKGPTIAAIVLCVCWICF